MTYTIEGQHGELDTHGRGAKRCGDLDGRRLLWDKCIVWLNYYVLRAHLRLRAPRRRHVG